MQPRDLYHTGIVVEDLDATRRWLTELAGYQWCDEYAGEQVVETPGGEQTVPLRFAYSMSEPRLELIAAVPGTVWVPATSSIHHLGYWSDDVDRDVTTLARRGLALEVRAPMPDGTTRWAYCRGGRGPRVELVSRLLRPVMAEWFATGHRPGA
jgi:Glyoxalase/Bleomycin resistance protein/Dioxygenase superfamily